MRKILLALCVALGLSAPCAAVGQIIKYVQLSTGATQSGGFNTSTGTLANLTVTSSATVASEIVQNAPFIVGTSTSNPEISNVSGENTSAYIALTKSAAGNGHGFSDYTTFENGPGNTAYAAYDCRGATGGSSSFDHLICYQGAPDHAASGTLSKLDTFYAARIQNGGTINFTSGLYVEDVTLSAGSITNQYGIYVEDQTHGGTISQAIHTVGNAPSEFDGGVINGSFTAAAIKATVPGKAGRQLYCSDCGTVSTCVSTGTLVNQWALITNKGSACN